MRGGGIALIKYYEKYKTFLDDFQKAGYNIDVRAVQVDRRTALQCGIKRSLRQPVPAIEIAKSYDSYKQGVELLKKYSNVKVYEGTKDFTKQVGRTELQTTQIRKSGVGGFSLGRRGLPRNSSGTIKSTFFQDGSKIKDGSLSIDKSPQSIIGIGVKPPSVPPKIGGELPPPEIIQAQPKIKQVADTLRSWKTNFTNLLKIESPMSGFCFHKKRSPSL